MDASIEARLPALQRLCRMHGVRRLDLFGSAAHVGAQSPPKDIDLLVALAPMSPADYARTYFSLKGGLEALLGRPVDLLTDDGVQNPYRRARIDSQRVLLYAP